MKLATRKLRRLQALQHKIIAKISSHLLPPPQSQNATTTLSTLRLPLSQSDLQDMPTDTTTYASLIRLCGDAKDLAYGRRVHARIIASGSDRNTFMANLLIQMYGKCKSVKDARSVFNTIAQPNMFSWNFMIAAYVQNKHDAEALHLYNHMQLKGVKPNQFTFLPILSASATLRALANGRQIHEHIVASNFHCDVSVRTALVNMYGKCGSPKDARAVFDEIEERDLVLWNAMIAAYAQNQDGKGALELFRQMDLSGIKPDRITFLCLLEGCASCPSLDIGRMVHERVKVEDLESDVAVKNALVNMYGKCGSLNHARDVFAKIDKRDVISWTAMIAAHAENGHGKEALELFRQMDLENIKPNRITFLSALDACASMASISNGKMIHQRIVFMGFESDVIVSNALVNMYGKCGALKDALLVFEKMDERNVISWNAMIAAYAQNGHGEEALQLLRQMNLEGTKPNRATFLTIVNACARLSSLENGKAIHDLIVASGLDSDATIRNALVDMYGKCGSINQAWTVFDKIYERDVISWNAMIAACTQCGHGKEALQLFKQMELEGVKPNATTLLSTLNVCSHAGLLDVAWQYFVSMSIDCNDMLSEEHYTCMSDLLGRMGSLDEAEDLIINKLGQPSVVAWNSLLGACRIHGDVERGARAADNVFELDPEDATPYVLLSNIYAAVGRWNDVANVRKAMEGKKKLCCYKI